jgi:hypothetical protein
MVSAKDERETILPATSIISERAPNVAGHQVPMIPISISAEALVAIAKSFPMGWHAEGSLDGKGGCLLILPLGVAELLRAIRQPGEAFRM